MLQAEEFFTSASKEEEALAEEDTVKEFWSKHPLYLKNTRDELVQICSSKKLLGTGKKHELVERIAKATEGESAFNGFSKLYNGNLSEIPSSVTQLNKLPVRLLRAVLRFHGQCPVGSKDELIFRVGLLKGGQIESAFSKERMELIRRITILRDVYKMLTDETHLKYIFKSRTFGSGNAVLSTREKCGRKEVLYEDKAKIKGTVNGFLDRLEHELLKLEDGAVVKIGQSVKSCEDTLLPARKRRKITESKEGKQPERKSTRQKKKPKKLQEGWVDEERELVTQVGARVDVLWTKDDLKETSWTPGWYQGEVQEYDDDNDEIRVLYKNDVASTRKLYSLSVSVALADGLVKLKQRSH